MTSLKVLRDLNVFLIGHFEFDGEQPDAGIQILTQNADKSFEEPPSQTFSDDNISLDCDDGEEREGSAPPQLPPAKKVKVTFHIFTFDRGM